MKGAFEPELFDQSLHAHRAVLTEEHQLRRSNDQVYGSRRLIRLQNPFSSAIREILKYIEATNEFTFEDD